MLTLSNQRPAVLDPVRPIPVTGDYDPEQALRRTVVEPLLQPLAGASADLVDAKGTRWSPDDVAAALTAALGEDVDDVAEEAMKDLFVQGLVSFDPASPLLANAVMVVQSAARVRPALPAPSPTCRYFAGSDVIPSAKKLLSSRSAEDEFFASVGYTYSPETLGFWFVNDDALKAFQAWAQSTVAPLVAAGALPGPTTTLLSKFYAMRLPGLTEGLVLRQDENDGNEEYSFPRVLVNLLMTYQRDQRSQQGVEPDMGIMPFHLGELLIPKTVVLVNVEVHARSTATKVDNEWRLINSMLSSGVRVISKSALSKLTALPRAMAKASAQAATAASNRQAQKGRAAAVAFRKRPPTSVDISKGVVRALKRMKQVNRSRNILKKSKTTFLKASRRDPDDFNRPGRIVSTSYLPDLHLYLDTSGSISESNYQDTVMMLIRFAKKLNVDLYFSSFSDVLSQETLLRTSGRTVAQIWNEFRSVPKVSGGTDYRQIWEYVCASSSRKERFSLIVTDFEWYPPTSRVEHPKNLYYAPIAVQDYEWQRLRSFAQEYAKRMGHIEPAIAQRMIGVIV